MCFWIDIHLDIFTWTCMQKVICTDGHTSTLSQGEHHKDTHHERHLNSFYKQDSDSTEKIVF
ncbi:hypothetical protein BDF14DRAFT_1766646 [Spinellus fusiger]|nr:hypothetical protein BDF14DRAFT_1766646 [Spinellus fusiger]